MTLTDRLWLPLRYPHLRRRSRQPRSRKGLLILGWYGRETTGDKAILASILESIDFSGVDVYQGSYDVEYSRQTLREIGGPPVQVIANDLASLAEVLPRVDAVVIGGGPLMERRAMRDWLWPLLLAKRLGKKVMLYGCGVGPIRSEPEAAAIRDVLSAADEITLRDLTSVELALKLGVESHRVQVTADPALNFRATDPASPRDANRVRIGISIRSLPGSYYARHRTSKSIDEVRQQYLASFQAVVDFLSRQPAHDVVLVPMQMHPDDDDRQILHRVQQEAANPACVHLLESYSSPAELVQHFRSFDLVVGMRFHSIVFSYLAGTPAVGIDYDMAGGKVAGIMQLMESSDWGLNIADVTPVALLCLVQKGLDRRQELRARIAQRLKAVQAMERRNVETLQRLLRPE